MYDMEKVIKKDWFPSLIKQTNYFKDYLKYYRDKVVQTKNEEGLVVKYEEEKE